MARETWPENCRVLKPATNLVLVAVLKHGRLLALWPSLQTIKAKLDLDSHESVIRSKYLDEEAVTAGAAGSHFYTDEQLLRRELCRTHPLVVAALAQAWEACSHGAQTLGQTAYLSMARRIYLALTLCSSDCSQKAVSAKQLMVTALKDFESDADGKDHLTRFA